MKIDENEVVRINVRIPFKVVEWYKSKAKEYSFPYSSYMALLLIQNYENEIQKDMVKDFSVLMNELKTMTNDVSIDDFMDGMQDMKDMMGKIENKNK